MWVILQHNADWDKRQRQTICDKWIVYVFDITSICFHGKGILRLFTLHQKYREQSQSSDNQMIYMEYDSSWKQLSLVSDEEVISLRTRRSRIFRLCVMPGKMNENPQSNYVWEDRLTWFSSLPQYRTLDTNDGEPIELGWDIFQDSPHCNSATKSKSSCQK